MTSRGSLWSFCLPLVIAAAACGGKAKPPPPPPPPVVVKKPPPPPPPPVCVPRYEPARITMANGDTDGGHAQFCVSDDSDQSACFEVDLEAGTYVKLDASPIPQEPSREKSDVHVEATPTEVKVCLAEGACKSLKPKVAKNASQPIPAAVDDHGATAVLMLGDGEAGTGTAEVWDVAKARRITAIRYAKGDNKCGEAQVLGDVVYISASVCAGPAAHGWLYSLKGKKLADVGGKDFGTYATTAVQVDGSQWAFLEEGGGTIALQDVKTGKVTKTIDLVSLWSTGGTGGDAQRAGGNPGESALVRGGAGKLLVIAGSPAAGNLAIVDVVSGDVKVISALACKDAAPPGLSI